ncbi:hypothetical protein BDZ89DRAFT_1145007 [Hymenopellis radicata]|nr:hypothetical protein BDZ89DRAFT_1145007 [Hymenopellis radicata]
MASGSRRSTTPLGGAEVLFNRDSSTQDAPLSPTPGYTKKRLHALERGQSYKKSRTFTGPSRVPARKEADWSSAGDEEREDDEDDGKKQEEQDEEEEKQMGRKFGGHPDTSPITKRVPGHFSPRKARG